jgi:hypothetical protein
MLTHSPYFDAYYTEQACRCEAARTGHEEDQAAAIVVPLRWVMAWVASVAVIGLGLGTIVSWLA